MKNIVDFILSLPSRRQATILSRRKRALLSALSVSAFGFVPLSSADCLDGCFLSNTYQGDNALPNFTFGGQDTAFGSNALASNTTGTNNTAVGASTNVSQRGGVIQHRCRFLRALQ